MIEQKVTVYPTGTNILPQFSVAISGGGRDKVRADRFLIDQGSLVFLANGMGGIYVAAAYGPGCWVSFTQEPPQ